MLWNFLETFINCNAYKNIIHYRRGRFMPMCPACWCPMCFEYGDGSYRCMECGCIFEADEDEDSD